MKPPGACGPARPGFLRSRVPPLGTGSQDSSVYVCIPSRVGGPPEQLFTIQRQKKSRSNSETKNPFPSWHLFLPPPSLHRLPLASVSLPGACTSLPAPGLGTCLPLPSPLAWGRHPSHPKMLLPRWLRCPLEFLPLVFCFWNSAGDEELISFLERLMGEGKQGQQGLM